MQEYGTLILMREQGNFSFCPEKWKPRYSVSGSDRSLLYNTLELFSCLSIGIYACRMRGYKDEEMPRLSVLYPNQQLIEHINEIEGSRVSKCSALLTGMNV